MPAVLSLRPSHFLVAFVTLSCLHLDRWIGRTSSRSQIAWRFDCDLNQTTVGSAQKREIRTGRNRPHPHIQGPHPLTETESDSSLLTSPRPGDHRGKRSCPKCHSHIAHCPQTILEASSDQHPSSHQQSEHWTRTNSSTGSQKERRKKTS
jgi:hypothetical protein